MKTFEQIKQRVLSDNPWMMSELPIENINAGTFVLYASQFGVFEKLICHRLPSGNIITLDGYITPAPPPARRIVRKHGTIERYNWSCRCEKCKRAKHREYVREHRKGEGKKEKELNARINFGAK